jgi:Tfp pilus assembly protein PilO
MYILDEEVVDECLDFYKKREASAFQFVRDIAEEDVPSAYRQDKVRFAVLNAEYDQLLEMEHDGSIFKKVFTELKEEMDASLSQVKQKLANPPKPKSF